MKKYIIGMVTMMLLSGAALAKDDSNGLRVVRAIITSDPAGKTADDLRIRLYVKNISSSEVRVFTRNLQVTLFSYTDRPKELSLNYSSRAKVDGSLVIPSLFDLSPVTLRSGEVAEIRIFYHDKKALKNLVITYDMRNDLARRFSTWRGVVRSSQVQVMKTNIKR